MFTNKKIMSAGWHATIKRENYPTRQGGAQNLYTNRGVRRGGSLEPPFWQASKHCSLHIRLAFHAPASTWAFVYHLDFQITHAGGRPLTILMVIITLNGIKVGVVTPKSGRGHKISRVNKIEPPFQNSCVRPWDTLVQPIRSLYLLQVGSKL